MYLQVTQNLTKDEQQNAIEQALINWKRDRVWQDVQHLVKIYARKLGVEIPAVKLSQEKRTWGTCGKDGVIRINWQLVDAPLSVLEYVVAHETVHLLHRNHGDHFWEALSCVIPDWRTRFERRKYLMPLLWKVKQLYKSFKRRIFNSKFFIENCQAFQISKYLMLSTVPSYALLHF
ncbi:YgjP-like metallopeptidase domain-containing protein [Nostoc sp. FACHB-145]|uniref:YgjP-like metallopeptidase domain-containing protein n=1 Tax=Nostoc sp. FACHB-145 TaxID=2692836 RepID=UPI0018F03AA8|nr:YgjP-like metallopeptidase domain-containing protein [Nostoc sp. FACHB-145]